MTAGKSGLLLSQGILGSIPLDAEKTESLSHTYFLRKAPLEVLVECWPTSSIESWECPLFFDDMASMELSLSSCAEICGPLDLRRVSQGNYGVA